jgi:inner membrane protein
LDAVGFRLGIPYGDFWGHRGFMHSLVFATIAGIVLSRFVGCSGHDRWKPALLLFIIVSSHGLLDALTNGGNGVALFSPFDLHRYFFPWRPIRVSPIGVRAFFSSRGMSVLGSEIRWVWLPALPIGLLLRFGQSVLPRTLPRSTPIEGAGNQPKN